MIEDKELKALDGYIPKDERDCAQASFKHLKRHLEVLNEFSKRNKLNVFDEKSLKEIQDTIAQNIEKLGDHSTTFSLRFPQNEEETEYEELPDECTQDPEREKENTEIQRENENSEEPPHKKRKQLDRAPVVIYHYSTDIQPECESDAATAYDSDESDEEVVLLTSTRIKTKPLVTIIDEDSKKE